MRALLSVLRRLPQHGAKEQEEATQVLLQVTHHTSSLTPETQPLY